MCNSIPTMERGGEERKGRDGPADDTLRRGEEQRANTRREESAVLAAYHGALKCRQRCVEEQRSGREGNGWQGVVGEDHVWFEDRWMVASWCDE
jgi:hypothetical protein